MTLHKQHNSGFLKIALDAKRQIRETSVEEVNARQVSGESFYLIDVREEDEWNQGRLPNAIHLSKGIIERDIEARIPDKNVKIVLYCGGGFRSALAAQNLQLMGYTDVLSMDGGFRLWKEKGFAVEY